MKFQSYLWFIAIGFALVCLSNCAYEPAFAANANGYMAKPTYQGENAGAWYFSGRMNLGYEYLGEEKNRGGEVAAHYSCITKNFYLSGGLYGYWGYFNTKPSLVVFSKPEGKYTFLGVGLRGDLGGRIAIRKQFDMLLGMSGEVFRENKYFRQKNEFGEGLYLQQRPGMTINIAPALDFRFMFNPNTMIGLRCSVDNYFASTLNTDALFYLQRYTLHTTLKRMTLFGQLGCAAESQKVYSLGMSYAIPTKHKFLKKYL